MKKLSTYSSSHTLRFPKVPQKLQKCQSIIISPSATSEKRRPVRRHVPSPRASERASAGYRASLAASPGAWEDLDAAAASVPDLDTRSSGSDCHFFRFPRPQGCGGCRARRPGPRDPLRGTRRSGLGAGGGRQLPSPQLLPLPGGSRDAAGQAALASRQSSGQELSCLDNLEMSALCLTCSREQS